MSWSKIKTYTKLTIIGLVVLAAIIFMASNGSDVEVRFLGWTIFKRPLWLFILIVGNVGGLFYLLMKQLRRVIVEIKAIRREKQASHRLDNTPKAPVSGPQDE